ncbi:hypothetical protein [Aquimarina mytili]|uniref:Uncharacterized protein n=1 Tax=Aquimarina mytili TaxID=874423 RepID=A0A937DA76_9FLAO|nr:hypothetical protein [Aquimarina mytili]MBL0683278.1 hypothetical protein [Aquimarina mytili]
MKTIICVLSIAFAISMGNAQKSSKSKVSIHYSDDESGNNYKVNISITNTDDSYVLKADFPTPKTEKLKKFLKNHLETTMVKKGSEYIWSYTKKDKLAHTVKLKEGKLDVYMNKKNVSADFVEDFIDIFSDLKEIVKE